MIELLWSNNRLFAPVLITIFTFCVLSGQEIRAPKSVELGLVAPNTKKSFQITISNPEKFSQRINIDTSCDCMVSEQFLDLEPGEEANIAIEFSSTGLPLGDFARRIGIVTEGAKNWVFVDILGEVGTIMVAEEKEVRFEKISRGKAGGQPYKIFTLQGRNEAPILPILPNSIVPFLKAEVVSLTKFYWELRIMILAEQIPIGQLSGSYRLAVSDELNRQILEIPIIWSRQVPISFDPNPLFISAIPGEEFEAKLNYRIFEDRRDSVKMQEIIKKYSQQPPPEIPPARIVSVRLEGAPLKYRLEKDCIIINGKLPEDAEMGTTGYVFVTIDDKDDPEHALRFVINIAQK